MKPLVVSIILALTLCACAQKTTQTPAAATHSKREFFYKEGATDKQLTRDLNACELKVFKSDVESDGQMHPPKPLTKKGCMQSLGYEAFYRGAK